MKKIVSVIMLIAIMLTVSTTAMATSVSLNLQPEKKEVEKGAEIKVSIGVNGFTREGDNKAIEGKIEFDSKKLEYKTIAWQNGWTGSISTDGTGLSALKSTEISESENIAVITYKVKENVEVGNTKIQVKDIVTSSNGDEVEASSIETTIKIIEKQEEPGDVEKQEDPDAGEKQEDPGAVEDKKDDTKTDEEMPETGVNSIIGMILVVGIAVVVCLIKYNRYKEV